MKLTFLSTFTLFLLLCFWFKKIQKEKTYQIKKIESINNWCVIYVIRNDSTYTILSKKNDANNSDGDRIRIGYYYNLKLSSIPSTVNDFKMIPINMITKGASVIINQNLTTYKVYMSANLKGLSIVN